MSAKKHVIYLHVNTVNGKAYVGRTNRCMKRRWSEHVRTAHGGGGSVLHCAIRKYGEESFVHQELTRVSCDMAADIAEVAWIFALQTVAPNGYNVSFGGGKALGYRHTPSAKEKNRVASTGRKPTEETRAKIGAFHRGNKYALGCVRSEETRKKMGAAKLGNTTWLGRKHTDESKKKIADAHRGLKMSDNTKAKLLAANVGSKHTQEHIDKVKASIVGKPRSEEVRRKISESHKLMHAQRRAAKESAVLIELTKVSGSYKSIDDDRNTIRQRAAEWFAKWDPLMREVVSIVHPKTAKERAACRKMATEALLTGIKNFPTPAIDPPIVVEEQVTKESTV